MQHCKYSACRVFWSRGCTGEENEIVVSSREVGTFSVIFSFPEHFMKTQTQLGIFQDFL